jgi:choline dehydrogenase-like flavoprotein
MIRDARSLTQRELTADVCIVGAGPAGLALAKGLSGSGQRVLLVESGTAKGRGPAQRFARGTVSAMPYLPLHTTRIRAVGGSSHHWLPVGDRKAGPGGMRAMPLDPLDFEKRDWMPNSGWPIAYAEVEPFYTRADEFLDLRPCSYATHEWWENPGQAIATESVNTVVIKLADPAVLMKRADELVRDPDIEIFTNATVLRINIDKCKPGHVESLTLKDGSGTTSTARARVYVIAGGGIENPRLLLLSETEGGVPIGSGSQNIGRYFMEHPAVNSRPIRMKEGSLYGPRTHGAHRFWSGLGLKEAVTRRERLPNFCVTLEPSDRVLGTPAAQALMVLYLAASTRRAGAHLVSSVARSAQRPDLVLASTVARLTRRWPGSGTYRFVFKLEQDPNPESKVVLSSRRDANGQLLPELQWRFAPDESKNTERMATVFSRGLALSGLGPVELVGDPADGTRLFWPSFHHLGTTRMGLDPASSVVDSDGKMHGMANLYVAGSSLFPTSGHANPTLTIIALAFRLAMHLRRLY